MTKVSNEHPIGTRFKKENIFLATISVDKEETKASVKDRFEEGSLEEKLFEVFLNMGAITSEQCDVFYKDEKGYTRFVEGGPETFVGDNSDGKGVLRNIVSIWDYYKEDEVLECLIDDTFEIIGVTDFDPLYRYNEDYNS